LPWYTIGIEPTQTTTPTRLPHFADLLAAVTDPVEQLLLTGSAATVREAEGLYLDRAYTEALALLAGGASDDELGRHPLFALYRSHGSRPPEDSVL
jgi:hypothetical protein